MPNATKIEWADYTWNPITGCPGPKVSPGCAHCYAERTMNTRLMHVYAFKKFEEGYRVYEEEPFQRVWFHPERLGQPSKIKKPSRIFVGSMCDLFHDSVNDEWIAEIFAIMSLCPQHTFMLLTKRPARMLDWVDSEETNGGLLIFEALDSIRPRVKLKPSTVNPEVAWPLPNVWLGVTVCNQAEADAKIPLLLQTPAAKRFVSIEPMLGPVDFSRITDEDNRGENIQIWPLHGCRGIDWVICGGETGPGARPMHPDWVRSLRDQCQSAEVPFFFKSWGEWLPTDSVDFYRGEHNVDFVQKYGRTGREFPNSEGRSIIGDGRLLLVDPPLKISNAFREKYKLPRNYKPDGRNLLIDAEAHSYAHKCGLHKVGYQWMYCVGKKRSGRLLDEREYNEIPGARRLARA